MENLKEFEALIKRYETITIEEIRMVFASHWNLAKARAELTGFGAHSSCSLCTAHPRMCTTCVYASSVKQGTFNHCLSDGNEDTYCAIAIAETPEELLKAYRNRALHMKTILEKWKTK